MNSESRLLLYLPGMEGTGKLFYRQGPELESRFKIVPVPCRSTVPFQYDDLVNDVLGVLNREGAQQATIVGESFGGTIAMQFALEHPSRVEQLVLVNTFSYYRPRIRLRLARMLLPLAFRGWGKATREFLYKMSLLSEMVPREDVSRLFECAFSHGYSATLARLQLIQRMDLRNRLQEIQTPVTIVASARDKVVPSVREARFMAERMKNARVIVLPKHGHTPMITPTFSLASIL